MATALRTHYKKSILMLFGISIAMNDTLNLDITLVDATQLCISSKCEIVLG